MEFEFLNRDVVKEMKWEISPEGLCEGYPDELVSFFHKVKMLDFKEKPNYTSLKKLLLKALKNNGY